MTTRSAETGILVTGGASYTTGMILPFLAPLMVDYFIRQYGLRPELAGTVVTAQFLVLSFAGLSVASLIGRFDATRVAVLSGLASAGGCLLAFQANSLLLLVGALLVANLGQGAAGVAAMGVTLASRNPPRNIAIMASIAYLYGAVWLFVIPQMEAHQIGSPPILLACAIATAIPMALVLLGARFVPKLEPSRIVQATSADADRPLHGALLLASQLAVYAGGAAVITFTVGIATQLSISNEMTGVLLAAGAIASGIGPMITPILRRRFSLASVTLVCLAAYAVACGFFGAGVTTTVFVVSALLVSVGQGMVLPLVFEIGLLLDPSGKTSGRTYSFIFFGYAVGPLIGGLGYGTSLLALGAVAGVTAALGAVGIGWILRSIHGAQGVTAR